MSTTASIYSAGSPLTRCAISVQVSRSSWESVTDLKEFASSCAIPIIYHEDADDEHDGLSARSAANAIYGLDGHDDNTQVCYMAPQRRSCVLFRIFTLQIHSVPPISKSPFISLDPSQYTLPDAVDLDLERTTTSCRSFPDSERLRSRLEDPEDDLAPSSDSEQEIFHYHLSMESEHTITFNVENDDVS